MRHKKNNNNNYEHIIKSACICVIKTHWSLIVVIIFLNKFLNIWGERENHKSPKTTNHQYELFPQSIYHKVRIHIYITQHRGTTHKQVRPAPRYFYSIEGNLFTNWIRGRLEKKHTQNRCWCFNLSSQWFAHEIMRCVECDRCCASVSQCQYESVCFW